SAITLFTAEVSGSIVTMPPLTRRGEFGNPLMASIPSRLPARFVFPAFRRPSFPAPAAPRRPSQRACDGRASSRCARLDPPELPTTATERLRTRLWLQAAQSRPAPAGRCLGVCGSHPPPGFSIRERALDFQRLQPGRLGEVRHADGRARLRREERGVERDVAD